MQESSALEKIKCQKLANKQNLKIINQRNRRKTTPKIKVEKKQKKKLQKLFIGVMHDLKWQNPKSLAILR